MPLKADNTNAHPEIEKLLEELGNKGRGLPYYALFIPGQNEPKHFPGVFVSSGSFLATLNDGVEIPKARAQTPAATNVQAVSTKEKPLPVEPANRM